MTQHNERDYNSIVIETQSQLDWRSCGDVRCCVDASEGDECGDGSYSTWSYRGLLALLCSCLLCLGAGRAKGGEVSGVVRMPEICSPAVSPAVVYLTPVAATGRMRVPIRRGTGKAASGTRVADLVLVNQRGLQFVPRVQAIEAGADRSVHQSGRRDAQRARCLA